MPFSRTDKQKVDYPSGISSSERRFARTVFSTINKPRISERIIVACSGGLDSTVLAHAVAKATTVQPIKSKHLIYTNHQLRLRDEIEKDIQHVTALGEELGYDTVECIKVNVGKGNVQDQARKARYSALVAKAKEYGCEDILLGHHANDVAETKLWQFLTGRYVDGIDVLSKYKDNDHEVNLVRPLLSFTKEDLVDYADIWGLKWSEDCTNATHKYARNRIRADLIPWIEREINPGIVKMLSKL